MSKKKYLLYVTLPYAYSIMRPLEKEIRRRGDDVAWFIEETCPNDLVEGEQCISTFEEAITYNPIAIFAPGNYIPDFLPGIKVALFHGYAIQKRIEAIDDHFTIRGWFDIYCTHGPSSTPYFQTLAQKHGFFRVYETGWPKADTYFSPEMQQKVKNDVPTILYAPTFTKSLCSAPFLIDEIAHLAQTKPWNWIITLHPKLVDAEIIAAYKNIAANNKKVIFYEQSNKNPLLQKSDVLLCDSSSFILEFMFLDKPVVTFRNSHPGPHLIDISESALVGESIEKALTRPADLMSEIRQYMYLHESHRDCQCSARVLDAVDDFLKKGTADLKHKPLNLIRKIKLRKQLHYPIWKGWFLGNY